MQGVAWASRQCLWVTLIWWLHKRERDDRGGAGQGDEPQRVFLTLGGGSLGTGGRQGSLVLEFGSLLQF